MGLDNDTRGWIMAVVSGIACTVGASIICVDLIIRQFPGKKSFKIEESNLFLSCGMSLSFGVMIFSSLYSILPSAKRYLESAGLSPKRAALVLIFSFLFGALAISVVSRIIHHYIPHSVVDCDHEHDDEEQGKVDSEDGEASNKVNGFSNNGPRGYIDEPEQHPEHGEYHLQTHSSTTPSSSGILRRPSLPAKISTRVSQLVSGPKEFCDENGQCFGYSDPCGLECFRNVQARLPRTSSRPARLASKPLVSRSQTLPPERQPLLMNADESALRTRSRDRAGAEHAVSAMDGSLSHHSVKSQAGRPSIKSTTSMSSVHSLSPSHPHSHQGHGGHQHHHHVPTNAFLSIGVQTSIAIALHKVPEGFITYATNHANPTLGLSIFLALFIHNITEGFALALPLYLALGSRWRAMFWSTLLGGASQPLGAAVAALWFKAAGKTSQESDDGVYGILFAVTAGIMTMVSLQLMAESLDLTHSRKVCFASAFLGMGILGLSSALTA